jgi:hypothetical protein
MTTPENEHGNGSPAEPTTVEDTPAWLPPEARRTLRELRALAADHPVTLAELARRVADDGGPPVELADPSVQRTADRLRREVLPALAEAGLVTVDGDRDPAVVRTGDSPTGRTDRDRPPRGP